MTGSSSQPAALFHLHISKGALCGQSGPPDSTFCNQRDCLCLLQYKMQLLDATVFFFPLKFSKYHMMCGLKVWATQSKMCVK